MSKIDYSTYLVTDTDMCPREKLIDVVGEAIRGGVTLIQLREKEISTREFYNEAVLLTLRLQSMLTESMSDRVICRLR